MSETSISPDISLGSKLSLNAASDRLCSSKMRCCAKMGAQKALNLSSVSASGRIAGMFFIVLPVTYLKVEPDAMPSITGRLCFKKK